MGEGKYVDIDGNASSLATSIVSTIRSSKNGKTLELKALRNVVAAASPGLHSYVDGAPDVDKTFKKIFKQAVKSLVKDGKVSLNAKGIVRLSKSERAKQEAATAKEDVEVLKSETKKKKKKKKQKNEKRKRESTEDGEADFDRDDGQSSDKKKKNHETQNGDEDSNNSSASTDPKDKNKPCKGNNGGITRLFLGNLPFAVDKPTLDTHFDNCITHVKWITDKDTGRFYGSAFCEVRTSRDAARCVTEVNGSQLLGRSIKINYAPMRPGEEGDWPPRSAVITGGKVANAGGRGQAGGSGIQAMSVKPEGCCKLFIGNLSYDIDDDGISKFFQGVDAEIKSVRWLHHKDSGDFKGCGFVDFWNTEACEKAAALNGKNLLGRPIRIDWTD